MIKTTSLFSDVFNKTNFLYMLHFSASEVLFSESAFAERNAAGTCLRSLVKKAKTSLNLEDFRQLVDSEIIPVLTKGFMAKNDRIQGEFVQVLISSLDQEGQLGSLEEIQHLQSEKNVDDEINFFDNMKHIQKHRYE